MIAIIDYDAGNLRSVEKAMQYIGEDVIISRDRDEILAADKVVLPASTWAKMPTVSCLFSMCTTS